MNKTFLNAQITQKSGAVINNGEVIVFDKIITRNANVGYDNYTGAVTLLQPGTYFAECNISTTASGGNAVITRINSSALASAVDSGSTQNAGQTYNSAIINVAAAPATLFVTNNSGAPITLSAIAEQGSLAIFSIDNDFAGGTTVTESSDNIISFNCGSVNWTMPTTWPFIIDGIDLSSAGAQLQPVVELLQILMNTASNVLSPLAIPAGIILQMAEDLLLSTNLAYIPDLSTLLEMLTKFTGLANQPNAVLKMNSYVGLASIGTEIQLGSTLLSVWGDVLAGPPYAIVMPRDGKVTAFEADLDALAALNAMQILNIIPGFGPVMDLVSGILSGISSLLGGTLSTVAGALLSLLGIDSIPVLNWDGYEFADGDTVRVVATLWCIPSMMGPAADVNLDPTTGNPVTAPLEQQGDHYKNPDSMCPIAKICLGDIELAHLAAWDGTTAIAGTALSSIATLLGLSGTASSHDASENGAFASGLVELPVPVNVNAGDSLMVEFSIESPEGLAIGAAIAAPNLSANIVYI